ncbi:unnamed protein product [Amoebophrya sp. A25]|nr:unnamed protein product [Amoebophrya sp. A25]|eukprot:GSA25T00013298001.1
MTDLLLRGESAMIATAVRPKEKRKRRLLSPLQTLPQAVLTEDVLGFLGGADLARLECTCRFFRLVGEAVAQRHVRKKLRRITERSEGLFSVQYAPILANDDSSPDDSNEEEEEEQNNKTTAEGRAGDVRFVSSSRARPKRVEKEQRQVPYEKSAKESWKSILYLYEKGFFRPAVMHQFDWRILLRFPDVWHLHYLELYDHVTLDRDLDRVPENAKYVLAAAWQDKDMKDGEESTEDGEVNSDVVEDDAHDPFGGSRPPQRRTSRRPLPARGMIRQYYRQKGGYSSARFREPALERRSRLELEDDVNDGREQENDGAIPGVTFGADMLLRHPLLSSSDGSRSSSSAPSYVASGSGENVEKIGLLSTATPPTFLGEPTSSTNINTKVEVRQESQQQGGGLPLMHFAEYDGSGQCVFDARLVSEEERQVLEAAEAALSRSNSSVSSDGAPGTTSGTLISHSASLRVVEGEGQTQTSARASGALHQSRTDEALDVEEKTSTTQQSNLLETARKLLGQQRLLPQFLRSLTRFICCGRRSTQPGDASAPGKAADSSVELTSAADRSPGLKTTNVLKDAVADRIGLARGTDLNLHIAAWAPRDIALKVTIGVLGGPVDGSVNTFPGGSTSSSSTLEGPQGERMARNGGGLGVEDPVMAVLGRGAPWGTLRRNVWERLMDEVTRGEIARAPERQERVPEEDAILEIARPPPVDDGRALGREREGGGDHDETNSTDEELADARRRLYRRGMNGRAVRLLADSPEMERRLSQRRSSPSSRRSLAERRHLSSSSSTSTVADRMKKKKKKNANHAEKTPGGVSWYRWREHAFGFSSNPDLFLRYADSRLAFFGTEMDSNDRLSWNLDRGESTGGWRAGVETELGDEPRRWHKLLLYRM